MSAAEPEETEHRAARLSGGKRRFPAEKFLLIFNTSNTAR